MKLLLEGIYSEDPVVGLTHNFYRYPARFSPLFTRAAIDAFTSKNDVVFDPFMGGGTTLVEASAMGRKAIGTDLNSLAVFLAQVKTTLLSRGQRRNLGLWAERTSRKLSVWAPAKRAIEWAELGYQRNMNTRETWRVRKLIELALHDAETLATLDERRFARCIVLKTAQWALDCRAEIPNVYEFRRQFRSNAAEMVMSLTDYVRAVRQPINRQGKLSPLQAPICLHRSAVGVEEELALCTGGPIRLVLTSPPYPGVHVLYHRWQIQGRRETPAAFWITNTLDGNGASYYTFGDRKAYQLDSYFTQAAAAFKSIAKLCDRDTWVVQMVAFSDPESQLPRYAAIMDEAGFSEVRLSGIPDTPDGRVWRSVPNRKWYASQRGDTASSNEVVLFHRLPERARK
jgi:hypothetical protein